MFVHHNRLTSTIERSLFELQSYFVLYVSAETDNLKTQTLRIVVLNLSEKPSKNGTPALILAPKNLSSCF